MLRDPSAYPGWLVSWMETRNIPLWGAADLEPFPVPADESGRVFPRAISFALPMNPKIMSGIQSGPNQAYADEYAGVNHSINELSAFLAEIIRDNGANAMPLAASHRTDTVNIKGDFPQKTAATRAGLGWIGRNCQLITKQFGPWVRLGCVFTDLVVRCGPVAEKGHCGNCRRCTEACPAGALTGKSWDLSQNSEYERSEILDVRVCDLWKKENYYQYHKGHNCGICAAVCPYGLKYFKASGETP